MYNDLKMKYALDPVQMSHIDRSGSNASDAGALRKFHVTESQIA